MRNPFKGAKRSVKAQKAARVVRDVSSRAETGRGPSTVKHGSYTKAGRGWLSWLRRK
jgi:hypothetical protein